jgi:hypothetical protein
MGGMTLPGSGVFWTAVALGLALGPQVFGETQKPAAVLIVSNPTALARSSEVVEIPLAELRSHAHITDVEQLVVRERRSGARVMSQFYDAAPRGGPDELLLLLDLKPKATLTLDLSRGASGAAALEGFRATGAGAKGRLRLGE